LQGYSFVTASAISSSLGRGDEAVEHIQSLVRRFVKPNTMYLEDGPVLETPLAVAQAVHELLLQSWGDRIRVFPAVPAAWSDVAFHDLRAEGAFLVSASRRAGQTTFIRVHSLAGEPCRVSLPWAEARLLSPVKKPVTRSPDGAVKLALKKGETAILVPSSETPSLILEPVVTSPGEHNFFGQKRPAEQR
jgi:alpha-L-fucosidase 2